MKKYVEILYRDANGTPTKKSYVNKKGTTCWVLSRLLLQDRNKYDMYKCIELRKEKGVGSVRKIIK